MNQSIYNIASMAAIFSMAAALFSLKKEYERMRRDIVKIVAGLGIVVKNNADGTTIHITERKKPDVKD